MNAIDKFHEHCRMMTAKQKELEAQKEKLDRQIQYFQEHLEIAKTLCNEQAEADCRKALLTITGLAEENQKSLDSLALEPLAEAAMQEFILKRRQLEAELQEVYQLAVEAQVIFINKLEKMGELVRESENLQYASMSVAKMLRQNPLARLYVGNTSQFEISFARVNELLKA